MTATDDTIARLRKKIRALTNRVAVLEAILKCAECGHLRSEHFEDDGPCDGGREGFKAGEGDYCACPGFEAESTPSSNDG